MNHDAQATGTGTDPSLMFAFPSYFFSYHELVPSFVQVVTVCWKSQSWPNKQIWEDIIKLRWQGMHWFLLHVEDKGKCESTKKRKKWSGDSEGFTISKIRIPIYFLSQEKIQFLVFCRSDSAWNNHMLVFFIKHWRLTEFYYFRVLLFPIFFFFLSTKMVTNHGNLWNCHLVQNVKRSG